MSNQVTRMAPDGTVRQGYYGDGPQPWDAWLKNGWAAVAAASCVHRYLARIGVKPGTADHDLKSARWYFQRLAEMDRGDHGPALKRQMPMVLVQLSGVLSEDQWLKVGGLMVNGERRMPVPDRAA